MKSNFFSIKNHNNRSYGKGIEIAPWIWTVMERVTELNNYRKWMLLRNELPAYLLIFRRLTLAAITVASAAISAVSITATSRIRTLVVASTAIADRLLSIMEFFTPLLLPEQDTSTA